MLYIAKFLENQAVFEYSINIRFMLSVFYGLFGNISYIHRENYSIILYYQKVLALLMLYGETS